MDDFAQALADHPGFASGWTQKLCYWANSQACSEKDPEFVPSLESAGRTLAAAVQVPNDRIELRINAGKVVGAALV